MLLHLTRTRGVLTASVISLLTVATLVLPARALSAPGAATQDSSVPVMRMGTGNNVMNTPWFIGAEKGLFLKHGVDVKVKLFNTGSEIQTALQAGELEIGNASFDVHIVSQSRNIRFKGFAFMVNDAVKALPDDLYAIILRPNSTLLKIVDLNGKKIGSTAGTTQATWVKAVLLKAGVPLDTVTFLNAQPGQIPAAFDGGGVDAVVTVEPNGELIMSRHPDARVLLRGGGYVGQRTVATATDAMLAGPKRAILEKVVAGLVEAAYIIRTQPQVVAEVVPHWLTGIEPNLALKAIGHIPFDPRMSPLVKEGWNSHAKLLIEQKTIKETPAFEPAFDMAMLNDVAKKYPQWLKDLKPLP
jgi:ABC-type nitrate/sulfonate/bicarbonate transport system substrate-binding protein